MQVGHNLGALHDSETQDCQAETSFIMAETGIILRKQEEIHARKFSVCSKKCIDATIKVNKRSHKKLQSF